MSLEIAVVDAFTNRPFSGNPAAICLLEKEISATSMQQIAREMNLSETAFVLPTREDSGYPLRWFTPTQEVDLCGHATLAAAFWMLKKEWVSANETLRFQTKSGLLTLWFSAGKVCMDFPILQTHTAIHPVFEQDILGFPILKSVRFGRNWIFQLADEASVRCFQPDFAKLAAQGDDGIAITAEGQDFDIVSRFFAPNLGIPEDPVTGFAHCALMDFWYRETGKTHLKAQQASERSGVIGLEKKEDRVILSGEAVGIYEGNFNIPI